MSKEVFLSKEGFKQLEEKLEHLRVVKRAEVAEKIKVARSFGDISENAEYDAAKEEQAMLEGEIVEIEQKLRVAKIIDEKAISKDIVSVGSSVKLLDIEYNEEIEYKIVGSVEADTKTGSISNESPLGKALLGRKKNDTVDVHAPNGIVKFKILGISI